MKTGIIFSICGALILWGTLANAQDEGVQINTHPGLFVTIRPSKVLPTELRGQQSGSFNQDAGYFKNYQGEVRTEKTDIATELQKIVQDRADGDTQNLHSDYKQLRQDVSELTKDREETYQVRENNQQEREDIRQERIKKMHDRYHRIEALRAQEHRISQYRLHSERLYSKENMAKQMTHAWQGGLKSFLMEQQKERAAGSFKKGEHGSYVLSPRSAVRK